MMMMMMMRSALLRHSGAARLPVGRCHLFTGATGQGTNKWADLKTLLHKFKALAKEIHRRHWELLTPGEKMLSMSSAAGAAWFFDKDRKCAAAFAEKEAAKEARRAASTRKKGK